MTVVLHFVLFLLKCLGILLLAILGLLLLVTVLVLFVPVRYRGRLEKKEVPEDILRADGLISWLNPFLRVRIRYTEKKLHYTVRIFGFCLLNSDKPKKDKPVKENKVKKENKKQVKEAVRSVSGDHETAVTPAESKIETHTEVSESQDISGAEKTSTVNEIPERATVETTDGQAGADECGGKKKASPFAKIKQIIEKIKAFPEKIKQKITRIINTVKLLWHKKEKVVAFLQDELHKTALGTAWITVKQVLRHVLPGKIKGQVEFGTGDPESTGKALGGLGILYAWYGKGVTVVPDFYEKRVVAELEFKGRIRFGTLLMKGVHLIRDKQVTRFRKNFKKLMKVLKQKSE